MCDYNDLVFANARQSDSEDGRLIIYFQLITLVFLYKNIQTFLYFRNPGVACTGGECTQTFQTQQVPVKIIVPEQDIVAYKLYLLCLGYTPVSCGDMIIFLMEIKIPNGCTCEPVVG